MRVFRQDNQEFAVGEVIICRGDFFDTLKPGEQIVERALRAARPGGGELRATSLYTWEDGDLAARTLRFSGRRFLYELEVEDSDLRQRADLNHYSAAKDAEVRGEPFEQFLADYWAGVEAGPPWTQSRIEVLVTRARVLRVF